MTVAGRAPTPGKPGPKGQQPGRATRWRTTWRRALPYAVLGAGGFLLGYLFVAFVVFPAQLVPTDSKVPNVVGLLYDDAASRLATSGFSAAQGEQRFNAVAPPGTVLAQTPPPGSRDAKGAKVTLNVSAGERRVTVPPVVGLTRELAQSSLENAGLEMGPTSDRENDAPRGAVIESSPAAGMAVAPSTRVTLVLSRGPALIAVPDLLGHDLASARQLLEQLGLVVGPIAVDSAVAGQPPNSVVGQTPSAGTRTRPGTLVTLRISGSPP